MHHYKKRDFPTDNIRHYLEPGPIVLVSSKHKDETNIMTMGWYTVMEFTPALLGCVISGNNHSFELIRKSKECVINLPTADMAEAVVSIGNCSGKDEDKFRKFELTKAKASKIGAPLIKECYANFECKLYDTQLINKYNFFIFKVVKAHVATSPKFPKTLHFRGDGLFMVSGKQIHLKSVV